MKQPLKIDTMYAFVCEDEEGNEGIVALPIGKTIWPMVGADMNRIDSLRAMAIEMAAIGKRPMKLIQLTSRLVLEDYPVPSEH